MADPLTDAIGAEFTDPLKKISTGAGMDPNAPEAKMTGEWTGGDTGIPVEQPMGDYEARPLTPEQQAATDAKQATLTASGGPNLSALQTAPTAPTPTATPTAPTLQTTATPTSANTGVMSPPRTDPNAPIDPNVAMNTVSTSFQSILGRAITPAEQQQLIGALGLQPGAPITQATIDQANQLIKQYASTQPGAQPAVPGNVSEPTPLAPGPTNPLQGTATPQTATPGGTIDPNTAMNTVNTTFQTALGRPMTPQEQQQLVTALGYQPGQPITQAMMDQAGQLISQYAASQGGAQPGAGTQPGAQPGATPGGIDPNKAMADISSQFLQKFGRAPTAQEQQWLTKMSGYTTGMVTPEQMAAAVSAMGRYTGDINAPIKPEKPQTPEEIAANTKLRELLGEEWGEVDETSKGFAGQKRANQLAQQRGTERKRAALAERAAQRGGLQAGGFDVEQERLLQQQGEGEQAFESKLYADELQGQRDRLMKGIEMAKSFGLQEDAQALQEKLGMLDIKLREYLGKGQLGLGLLNSDRQMQQFADQLGLSLAQLQNLMNTQAIGSMFA